MEPITHFMTGAVLSRAGFNRRTPLATLTMTLAAEAPDVDIAAYAKGPAYEFMQHRGVTHTFYAVPLIAGLVIGVVWVMDALWQRWRKARGRPPVAQRRWGLLFLFACVAALSHLLLDFTNNYGLRPFYPFLRQWHAWDIVFIFDPLIFAVLLAALILPRLFSIIDREIGARQKGPRGRVAAIAALLSIVAIWGLRDVEHRRAVAAIEATELPGERLVRAAAFPYMLNPFQWAGVAETPDAYLTMRVDSLHSEIDVDPGDKYYKPQPTEATQAAQDTAFGRAYMEWARFPLVEDEQLVEPQPAHRVQFLDVRFLYPQSRRRPLVAYVLLDAALQPVEAGFESTRARK